jgi:hypothetical protein
MQGIISSNIHMDTTLTGRDMRLQQVILVIITEDINNKQIMHLLTRALVDIPLHPPLLLNSHSIHPYLRQHRVRRVRWQVRTKTRTTPITMPFLHQIHTMRLVYKIRLAYLGALFLRCLVAKCFVYYAVEKEYMISILVEIFYGLGGEWVYKA